MPIFNIKKETRLKTIHTPKNTMKKNTQSTKPTENYPEKDYLQPEVIMLLNDLIKFIEFKSASDFEGENIRQEKEPKKFVPIPMSDKDFLIIITLCREIEANIREHLCFNWLPHCNVIK